MGLMNKRLEDITIRDFLGPSRISSWIPRKAEVKRICEYARCLDKPRIIDVGCGKLLASHLFALEGLDVRAIDLNLNPNQKWVFSPLQNLRAYRGDAFSSKWYKGRNVVFNSWMPLGQNWSYVFYENPSIDMIFYVKSKATGVQPNMPLNPNNVDSYSVPQGFLEIDRWKCFGHDDFESDYSPRIESCVGEALVHVREETFERLKERFKLVREKDFQLFGEYPWEKSLPKNF
ncbi:MAG: hypothetical protein QXX68_02715 [Candidatus Pacearchaeota archaeon]